MAGQRALPGESAGPGNKAIATTLLEWLAVRGRSAARDRAAKALGLPNAGLAEAPAWLDADALDSMWVAAEVDEALARSIGHRLVTPDATGLRLYGLGLATPEKAYRRLQSLLPRVEAHARWVTGSIENRSAQIRFERGRGADARSRRSPRVESIDCAFRKGLLEAIPGLYGLLPAEIEESACRARGDDACCYEVSWRMASHARTFEGAAIGSGIAAGIVGAAIALGDASLLALNTTGGVLFLSLAAAVFFPAFGVVFGRVIDLQAQLESVAGARRGHLALFDQVDDALAEKLDALARADASLEGESRPSPVRRRLPESGDETGVGPVVGNEILTAAQQIHAAAGDLECWFEARPETGRAGAPISDERGLVRDIREWAARIAQSGSGEGVEASKSVDLGLLVRRAVAAVRPLLPPESLIKIDVEDGLPSVECEPVQIEHVVVQLVRNAVEASVGLSTAPEVVVSLRDVSRGVELAVEDRGVGIDSTEVDEVFDPFFGDRPVGSIGGMGLPVCLGIVERHGGELRIEAEARAGTRVTVFLPRVKLDASDGSASR